MSFLATPLKWAWNTIDGRKTWISIIWYFAYLLMCQYIWQVEPNPDFVLYLKGFFGASLAHKVSKPVTVE